MLVQSLRLTKSLCKGSTREGDNLVKCRSLVILSKAKKKLVLPFVSAQYHPLLKTKSHDILSLGISILISVIFQDLYEPCAYHSLKDHGYEQLLINPLEYFVVSHFQHIHRQNIKRREGYEGLGETSQCPSMYINQYLFQCPYITLSNTSHHNFFFSRQHPKVGMQVRFPSVPIPPEEDSTSEWINDQVRSD